MILRYAPWLCLELRHCTNQLLLTRGEDFTICELWLRAEDMQAKLVHPLGNT